MYICVGKLSGDVLTATAALDATDIEELTTFSMSHFPGTSVQPPIVAEFGTPPQLLLSCAKRLLSLAMGATYAPRLRLASSMAALHILGTFVASPDNKHCIAKAEVDLLLVRLPPPTHSCIDTQIRRHLDASSKCLQHASIRSCRHIVGFWISCCPSTRMRHCPFLVSSK